MYLHCNQDKIDIPAHYHSEIISKITELQSILRVNLASPR